MVDNKCGKNGVMFPYVRLYSLQNQESLQPMEQKKCVLFHVSGDSFLNKVESCPHKNGQILKKYNHFHIES